MNNPGSDAHREDVMYQYAVEPDHDGKTLTRYLRAHPDYAGDLLDLQRELTREPVEEVPRDDPLASLSVVEQRRVTRELGVPRQVLSALRERRVVLQSIPPGFLAQFADALNTTVDALTVSLAAPVVPGTSRSYRADKAPTMPSRVTFEQLLVDAKVSEEKRQAFLEDRR